MAAGAVIAAAAPAMVIGIESANACRYRRAFMICPVCKRVYFRLALNEPTGVCEPAEAMRSALRARGRPRGARPGWSPGPGHLPLIGALTQAERPMTWSSTVTA